MWKPRLALGVTQTRLSGTMPSTKVQAELQMPSMMTRSPRSRIWAYLALYSSTNPPWSRVTRYKTSQRSRRRRWLRNIADVQPRPVHAVDEGGELRCRQPHHAIAD